jgi:hypothetical protein
MKKLAAELVKKHGGYIEALREAIEMWDKATDLKEKRKYILVIGEIGKDIHRLNMTLRVFEEERRHGTF